MTTRADVDRLTAANRNLVAMAKADLQRLIAGLEGASQDTVAAALHEMVPALVREYGEVAAAVAVEWYSELREGHDLPTFQPSMAEGVGKAVVNSSVGYALSSSNGELQGALALLGGALQRHIWYSSRETVRRNVALDPSRPRYARVPSGAKTCAFCEMLASRGFVYHSKKAAGDSNGTGLGDDYHNDCDCAVVVEFDKEQHHIEGYDPDAMYARYRAARAEVDSRFPSTNDILSKMRELNPDIYTDGHIK